MQESRGRYSRGYLPHVELQGVAQFVTWRLADSVPVTALDKMREEVANLKEEGRGRELLRKIEAYADAGHGSCLLRRADCARIVPEALFHDHGVRYALHAWCIMPNHVHVLLTPVEDAKLSRIVNIQKAVTAPKINRLCRTSGALFQEDYYDTFMRDGSHHERVRRYIEWNPVKANLCQDPVLWSWSSANKASWDRLNLVLAQRKQDVRRGLT